MSIAPKLALSDDQLSAITRACQPLQPMERSALLSALAHRLRGYRDVGDGELHRIIRELLREVWKPPRGMVKEMNHRRSVGEPIA